MDKKTQKHTVNGWAKLVRTPRFKLQVVTDQKKQENKLACRKPVFTNRPETRFAM